MKLEAVVLGVSDVGFGQGHNEMDEGRTARVLAALLTDPQQQMARIYHMTGLPSENIYLRIAAPAMR